MWLQWCRTDILRHESIAQILETTQGFRWVFARLSRQFWPYTTLSLSNLPRGKPSGPAPDQKISAMAATRGQILLSKLFSSVVSVQSAV